MYNQIFTLLLVLTGLCGSVQSQDSIFDHPGIGPEDKIENISPNPITNLASIQLNYLAKDCQIKVLNILGKEIISRNAEMITQINIDFSNLSAGPYIVSYYKEGKLIDSKRVLRK